MLKTNRSVNDSTYCHFFKRAYTPRYYQHRGGADELYAVSISEKIVIDVISCDINIKSEYTCPPLTTIKREDPPFLDSPSMLVMHRPLYQLLTNMINITMTSLFPKFGNDTFRKSLCKMQIDQ